MNGESCCTLGAWLVVEGGGGDSFLSVVFPCDGLGDGVFITVYCVFFLDIFQLLTDLYK